MVEIVIQKLMINTRLSPNLRPLLRFILIIAYECFSSAFSKFGFVFWLNVYSSFSHENLDIAIKLSESISAFRGLNQDKLSTMRIPLDNGKDYCCRPSFAGNSKDVDFRVKHIEKLLGEVFSYSCQIRSFTKGPVINQSMFDREKMFPQGSKGQCKA